MSSVRFAEPEATIERVRGSSGERAFAQVLFWVGLVVLIGSAWWFGRGLWFFSDEWNVIAVHHSGHWTTGFNGQWLFVPTAFFWVLLKAFGLFTYWPFRLVGLAWYTAFVLMFHAWARRRVRPLVAALAALAVAWYSTSWNVVMMPLLMNFTIPVTMLFASWILLDRNRRRSDIGVAACLAIGVLSSNVGLVVCVIVAIEFALSRVPWRRWWVFLPAAVMWIPWFAIWYEPIGPAAKTTHAAHWGIGLTENYARGFFSGWRVGQWIWLAVLVAVSVWALLRRRWNPRSIGILVGLVFFVAGAAYRAADFHIPIPPNPNWYLWLYSVLVAALLVELLRGVVIPVAVVAVLAVVIGVGAFHLFDSLSEFHTNGLLLKKNARTWFAAADALGSEAHPDATLAVNFVQLPVRDYATLRRDMGSLAPGATLADLGDEGTRQAVDAWMVTNLDVGVEPGLGPMGVCRPAPDVQGPGGSALLPGTQVRIVTGADPTGVRLRRFALGFAATPTAQVGPHQVVHFSIPTDHSSLPWYLQVDDAAQVSVCS